MYGPAAAGNKWNSCKKSVNLHLGELTTDLSTGRETYPGASRLGKRKKPVNPVIGSACLFVATHLFFVLSKRRENSLFFFQLRSSFEKKKGIFNLRSLKGILQEGL